MPSCLYTGRTSNFSTIWPEPWRFGLESKMLVYYNPRLRCVFPDDVHCHFARSGRCIHLPGQPERTLQKHTVLESSFALVPSSILQQKVQMMRLPRNAHTDPRLRCTDWCTPCSTEWRYFRLRAFVRLGIQSSTNDWKWKMSASCMRVLRGTFNPQTLHGVHVEILKDHGIFCSLGCPA